MILILTIVSLRNVIKSYGYGDEADVMVVMGVKHQGRVHGDTPRGGGDVLVSVMAQTVMAAFIVF